MANAPIVNPITQKSANPQAQGYNISTLSRKADVPLITVRRLWNNPRYRIRLDTLERIADTLGVGVSDLIEDVPNE